MRNTLRRKLEFFELIGVAAILLGVAVIAGIFYTYDVSRQTAADDARAQAQLEPF